MKRWADDHSGWHLTRHFFRALLDWNILTQAGADSFTHMLLGGIGVVLAFGFGLTRIYIEKYAGLAAATTAEPYRQALFGDDLLIVGLPMLLSAFLAVLVGPSLFPDETDFRVLGPLPVEKAAVFRAKLGALLLFAGLFIAVVQISLASLMIVTSVNPWRDHSVLSRLAALLTAGVAASFFGLFAITAVMGVLLLAVSNTRLQATVPSVRAVLLGALVICLPLVLGLPALGRALSEGRPWLALLPPAWFVGLERLLLGELNVNARIVPLGGVGLAATAAAALIVTGTYTFLFRHFERLMIRPGAATRRTGMSLPAVGGSTPAFRAVYRFTLTTLVRSPMHQTALVAVSASGVALAVTSLLGSGTTDSALARTATWIPFVLMLTCGLGLRAAFALPLDHRANWIFRITEDEGTRTEQLRAVEQVVTTLVVALPVAVGLPLLWLARGGSALGGALVVAGYGLVFVHAVLLEWRRIPFTCSYLPGKRFVAQSLAVGFIFSVLFTVIGRVLLTEALGGVGRALLIATALFVVAFLLRRRRSSGWRRAPLMFEDEFPDQPLGLGL